MLKKTYLLKTRSKAVSAVALLLALVLMLSACSFFINNPDESDTEPTVSDEPKDTESEQVTESDTDTDGKTDTAEPTDTVTDTNAPETLPPDTEIKTESETEIASPVPNIVDTSKAEYSYTEMVSDLEQLASAYPKLFSYREIGRSCDGRALYVAVLGSPNAPRQIIADAGTHGREYLNPMFVMATLEYYLQNYDRQLLDGKSPAELFSDTALYVVPMMNPDGITISQFGSEALLTEELRTLVYDIYQAKRSAGLTSFTFAQFQKYWKANGRGVDINRNFDVVSPNGKEYDSPPTSPDSTGYPGDSPMSEPETRAYASLVESLSNPIACISVHSQGSLIYWDCGQDYSGRVSALALANSVKGVNVYPLYYADSFTAASSDWCMLVKNIPSITIETGKGVCPLPLSEFENIFSSCRDIFLAVSRDIR